MKNTILSIIILLIAFGLSAERITLNSAASRSVTWTVLDCHDDYTTIEVSFNFYDSRNVLIDGYEYYTFNVPSGAVRIEKGNPELPVVANSIMIPPMSKMGITILEAIIYKEISGNVIPSKGR